MRLIGAGLPRTGTLSQRMALEMLGLKPCHHMVNVLSDLDQAAGWRRVLDGEMHAAEMLDGFDAAVDWPTSFFYEDMMEAYPDAKVLLSVRDPEAWARSMRNTIWGLFYDHCLMRYVSSARSCIDSDWRAYIEMMQEMWQRSGLLNGDDTTAEWMSAAMVRYHDQVRATVPPERLLVWTASDGWEPLCEFLELPVPGVPFPRLNDGAEFADRIVDASLQVIQGSRDRQPEAVGV